MACSEAAESSYWIVGVLMSIIASTCTNLGVNMQKFSFIKEAKVPAKLKRPYAKQPLWIFGLFLVIVGSLGDFAALGFAPQTLITPVGGFTMVANVIFARFFLNEAFHRRDAIATSLIIAGVIGVAAFADKQSKCFSLEKLISLYGQFFFIVYAIFIVVVCVYLFRFVKKMEKIHKKYGPSSKAYQLRAKWHPVCYPALSGIFGAQSVLLAKSTAELIKMTFAGNTQLDKFGTYVIALGMFSCIFLQIHWLAEGLQYFDAVFVVPVFQCFFISTSILGGAVYFDEFSSMGVTQLFMFFVGVMTTLVGVAILSQRDMTKLKPIGKFRSGVHSIIFIKRVQKRVGQFYQWKLPKDINSLSSIGTSVLATDDSMFGPRKYNSAAILPSTGCNNLKIEQELKQNLLGPKPNGDGSKIADIDDESENLSVSVDIREREN